MACRAPRLERSAPVVLSCVTAPRFRPRPSPRLASCHERGLCITSTCKMQLGHPHDRHATTLNLAAITRGRCVLLQQNLAPRCSNASAGHRLPNLLLTSGLQNNQRHPVINSGALYTKNNKRISLPMVVIGKNRVAGHPVLERPPNRD